jgi:hypothetical protein
MSYDDEEVEIPTELRRRINERVREIRRLYNMSDAEYVLLQQMSTLIRMTSPATGDLFLKLVKVHAAITEMIHEETKHLHEKEDDCKN